RHTRFSHDWSSDVCSSDLYAYEIAADYSHPVVRSASFLLTTVWNRIFRGVLVHHLDQLKAAAPGHEVVYVPCHRSHMDYLLLSRSEERRGGKERRTRTTP